MHNVIIETAIVIATLKALLADGYKVNTSDNPEPPTEGLLVILSRIKLEDDEPSDMIHATKNDDWYFVKFVYGNGCDVISDYSVTLEKTLEPVNRFANALDGASKSIVFGSALSDTWDKVKP